MSVTYLDPTKVIDIKAVCCVKSLKKLHHLHRGSGVSSNFCLGYPLLRFASTLMFLGKTESRFSVCDCSNPHPLSHPTIATLLIQTYLTVLTKTLWVYYQLHSAAGFTLQTHRED